MGEGQGLETVVIRCAIVSWNLGACVSEMTKRRMSLFWYSLVHKTLK